MKHQSNVVKGFMSNLTEYQMSVDGEISSIWFGKKEFYLPACPKICPLEVKHYGDSQKSVYDYQKEDRISHCTYEPKNADLLHSLDCMGFLPHVQVKDEFKDRVRICYKKYAFFSTIIQIEMMYGMVPKTTLDSNTLLLCSQLGVSNDKREGYEYLVGNRPELLEWNTELPLSRIQFTLPFTFCTHPKLCIPLFLHSQSKMPVTFQLEFRPNLNKIIQMQELDSMGEWQDIPFEAQYIEKETVVRPDLVGKFFTLLEDEKNDMFKELLQNPYRMEYGDFMKLHDDELFSATKEILLNDETPTKTIFWWAQHEDAINLNKTQFTDPEGNEPSKRSIIYMGDSDKNPFFVVDKFEDIKQQMNHAIGKPALSGFHFYHLSVDQSKLFSLSMPVSLQLKDLNLKLKYIINDNVEKKRDKKTIVPADENLYKLFTYLDVSKRVIYSVKNPEFYTGKPVQSIEVSIEIQETSGEFIKNLIL